MLRKDRITKETSEIDGVDVVMVSSEEAWKGVKSRRRRRGGEVSEQPESNTTLTRIRIRR